MLRIIFVCKTDEVIEQFITLHKKEFRFLYTMPATVSIAESRGYTVSYTYLGNTQNSVQSSSA
jgi:hypothetical protein